jgi:hypothetical protein
MSLKPPTPSVSSDSESHENLDQKESRPSCPTCGACEPTKNGTYQRNPHGTAPVRMQQYECIHGDSFTESLDWIKDSYQYPTFIIRLCLVVFVLTDASLGTIQDIVTVAFNERPSKQRISEWAGNATGDQDRHREPTQYGEVVINDLPTYSGIYTYDEQYVKVDHCDAYRLTVYDSLMQAPVAEQLVRRCTKEIITEFLTTALAEKPIFAVTTDGRSDYAEIVEDELGALVADECAVEHHRGLFHFLRNVEDALERELESVRYSSQRKCRMAIVTSEFKQALREGSYPAAVRRFDDVLGKLAPLSPKLEGYVMDVVERFDTFAGYLRDEWIPSTTNDCEQYYSHTQSARRLRRLRSPEQANGVLWQQQRIRTIKEGLISRETSVELAKEMFPGISSEAVNRLFVESKKRYLRACPRNIDRQIRFYGF